jgi:hypothetical protein
MVLCGTLCRWHPVSDRGYLLDTCGMSFDCRDWLFLLSFGYDAIVDIVLCNN